MTSTDFILLLTNTESVLQKKRTRSLARAQWADVLEVDAQIALCGLLRKAVVGLEEQSPIREASRHPMGLPQAAAVSLTKQYEGAS